MASIMGLEISEDEEDMAIDMGLEEWLELDGEDSIEDLAGE